MNGVRLGWTAALVLLVAATIAIHYQVKVRLHHGTATGKTSSLGKLKVNEVAPDFTLADLGDGEVALSSFRGTKVVVLDFWATWCGPCRMAMPDLQKLHEELAKDGVLLISVNQSEPKERVRAFIDRKKYTFRTVLDSAGEVGRLYGVRALPTLVVVDKQGRVRHLSVGRTYDDSALRKDLLMLTREP